ncbi:DUF5348 domain-containing protein [Ruminiclostridium cellobioparum]|uniref:DUF5348 domain-containing protein n=1 Tax=Ruminiclostridium cellobioparum TaxID=29355 RepID=UPI0028A81B2F|nr:DUF5348 domain-containing protein [Ruminiclostridium cellobioparum]
MNDLEKVLSSASSLSWKIGELVKESKFEEYDDLSGLNINYTDEEQLLLQDELRAILDHLEKAKRDIDYLNRPIAYTGYLHKNSRGRYETGDKEYTSGSGIEVLIYDDFYEKNRWVKTRVEHNGDDYYLVGYGDISMQGLKVRIRK